MVSAISVCFKTMWIELYTLVSHINVIGTEFICLVVKRLSDITDKVNQELQSLGGIGCREATITNPLGVVDDGRDGAARRTTVSVVVDVASGGWVILGVNKMQRSRPGSGRCLPVVIRPGSDVGQVRVRIVIEDALGPIVFIVSEVFPFAIDSRLLSLQDNS